MNSGRLPQLLSVCLVFLAIHAAFAQDWPTYRGDVRRSGGVVSSLPAKDLGHAWTYRSPYKPQSAWPAPARWDASNLVRDLRSMRNYDPVFQPVAVGDAIYFGSSGDDKVTALEAATGNVRWQFATGGPVRIAPTIENGRVYVGSDDGWAYCLSANKGELIWKYRPHESSATVLHNGRAISFWPIRTGVVVFEGTAYFAASMLPWKKSYLCALDAETGKVSGAGRFSKELENVVLEGPPVIAPRGIIIPQGRSAPLLFAREDGKSLGTLGQQGGCFLLLDDQGKLFHAPGNRHGGLLTVDEKSGTKGTLHPRAHLAAARGEWLFLADDTTITAIHATKGTAWRKPVSPVFELIAAGEQLFVGGDDQVAAFDVATGERVWQQPVFGRAFGLAIAAGRLIVSTDEGHLHTFVVGGTRDFRPAELERQANDPSPAVVAKDQAKESDVLAKGLLGRWQFARQHVSQNPEDKVATIADLAGKSPGTILGNANWERSGEFEALVLDGRSTGVLLAPQYRAAAHPTEAFTVEAWVRVDHKIEWGGVVGMFQDNGPFERGWLLGYRKDRFFLATAAEKPGSKLTYLLADEPMVQREWQHVAGTYDGSELRIYINGRLAGKSQEQQGKIHYPPRAEFFLGGYKDENEHYPLAGQIHEVRLYDRALSAAELAANIVSKPTVPRSTLPSQKIDTLSLAAGPTLQFTGPTTARVKWTTHQPSATILEHDLGTGVQTYRDAAEKREHVVTLTNLRRDRLTHYRIETKSADRSLTTNYYECDSHHNYTHLMRPAERPASSPTAAGQGVWTHMYGLPNNSAYGGETLGNTTKSSELEVAWLGPPGPRFQIDRQNRKPSPLAIHGRLFVQGFGRVMGLDAQTGNVLWAEEMPHLRRLNIPRDCANWCLDDDRMFLAVGDRCEFRQQTTGEVLATATLPTVLGNEAARDRDWGYVARSDKMFVGSSVLRGSQYTDWWGWDQWWDDPPGNGIVCSDVLFAMDVATSPVTDAKTTWKYTGGAILNPTITIADDTVYFVESLSPQLKGQRCGRFNEELWAELRLVALDLTTGKERWRQTIMPQPGRMAFYLAHSDGKLVLVASNQGKFHIQTYAAADGKLAWEKQLPWESNHHGKHISRPALVGGKVIVRPHVLDLATGDAIYSRFPAGHTCASYVCTANTLFLRATELTEWDLKANTETRFPRLRPDCWISSIPACGMYLVPEGGGGCSCGSWLETSIGFGVKKGG